MSLNYDCPIEEMNVQELKNILDEEWEREDLDVDLIKRITHALEVKSGVVTVCDVEAAWQRFLILYEDIVMRSAQ